MTSPSLDAIRRRCEDAWILWNQDRQEGAFLLSLVAIAAASRRKYPQPIKDRDAFISYLRDQNPWKHITLEYRGKQRSLEEIFYEALRCNLIHEGDLAPDVEFLPDDGTLSFRAGGAPDFILKLTPGWFMMLLAFACAEIPATAEEIFAGMMFEPRE